MNLLFLFILIGGIAALLIGGGLALGFGIGKKWHEGSTSEKFGFWAFVVIAILGFIAAAVGGIGMLIKK